MSKLENWEVCRSTVGQWDDLWNWTVFRDGNPVDMFHTKQKAVEFAKERFMIEHNNFCGIQNLAEDEALRIHEKEMANDE